jgi:hypothetical protein
MLYALINFQRSEDLFYTIYSGLLCGDLLVAGDLGPY